MQQCEQQEELPIRLAHRVKDLDELPLGLHDMPSIKKVKNWYAQSFEVSLNRHPGLPLMSQTFGEQTENFES